MPEKNSQPNSKTRQPILAVVIAVFVLITVVGSVLINATKEDNQSAVYNIVAFNVIMIWMCIFTTYFIWALRFYNINFGLTNNEWDKIDKAKQLRRDGLPYNQFDLHEEPKENPYKSETFGLPNGTVRGMIAFTLLFGAIAILIASLAPQNQLKSNSFLVDQFEFFKTAFLMMIAFYFGTRSLEFLKGKPAVGTLATGNDEKMPEVADPTVYDEKTNADQMPQEAPKINVSVAGNVTTIPIITPVKDPMAFNE